jgi:hypothetical protein
MHKSPAKIRPEGTGSLKLDDYPNQQSTNLESISRRHFTTSRQWERKETVRCVFCRGSRCKRCGKNAYLIAINSPIEKFHCNWITDEIMAMQRPADELFDTINLLEAFQENKITAVINLTEPGEHPFCGFKLKASGFPYTPERLMNAGSKCFDSIK